MCWRLSPAHVYYCYQQQSSKSWLRPLHNCLRPLLLRWDHIPWRTAQETINFDISAVSLARFLPVLLATLPVPRPDKHVYQLIAVRPARFVYTNTNGLARLVEQDGNEHSFPLPTAITRPALLLEPMVANALCESNTPGEAKAIIRSVIEWFG